MRAPAFPMTLRQVAEMSVDRQCHVSAMKEFIDHVCDHAVSLGYVGIGPLPLPEGACFAAPQRLADPAARANIDAMAEHLSILAWTPPPPWSQAADGFLDAPIFVGGANARPYLLADTPSAFRRRLLFVGPVLGKLWARAGARRGS